MHKKLLLTALAGGSLFCGFWGAASFAQTPDKMADNAPAALPAALPVAASDAASLSHWMTMGEGSRIALQKGDENRRALRFDYQVKPGQFGAMVTPLTPGALSDLGSMSLRVKADHSTSLVVAVEEEGGGRFSAPFALIADKWQNVQLAPADFTLQTGKDDPKDADGKLDWNRAKNLSLLDFSQLFAQMAKDESSPFAGIEMGQRSLWLDQFALSQKPLPAVKTEANVSLLDGFARPQVNWMGVGNVALERANDGALDGPALKMTYRQQFGRIAGMIKPLVPGALQGRRTLNFDVVGLEQTVLLVQLEEVGGGKYNMPVEVPGRAKFTPVNLEMATFKPADDSRDNNGRLDLGEVKQLLILDAAGLLKLRQGDNTLWLGAVRAR